MERTHVWSKLWAAVMSAFMGGLFIYWQSQSDGYWQWFFFAMSVACWFFFFGDMRKFFEELDRRRDIEREERRSG